MKKNRKTESRFWQQFEHARPRILSALLDVVALILKTLPGVQLKESPRMADFARWITAAEPALGWKRGTFLAAYNANRMSADEVVLDGSSIAAAVKTLAALGDWQDTATELLAELKKLVSEQETKAKSWPKNALALSNQLRRLAPSFRAVGVDVLFFKESKINARRLIRISTQNSDVSDVENENSRPAMLKTPMISMVKQSTTLHTTLRTTLTTLQRARAT